jgi:hypothetical protein
VCKFLAVVLAELLVAFPSSVSEPPLSFSSSSSSVSTASVLLLALDVLFWPVLVLFDYRVAMLERKRERVAELVLRVYICIHILTHIHPFVHSYMHTAVCQYSCTAQSKQSPHAANAYAGACTGSCITRLTLFEFVLVSASFEESPSFFPVSSVVLLSDVVFVFWLLFDTVELALELEELFACFATDVFVCDFVWLLSSLVLLATRVGCGWDAPMFGDGVGKTVDRRKLRASSELRVVPGASAAAETAALC